MSLTPSKVGFVPLIAGTILVDWKSPLRGRPKNLDSSTVGRQPLLQSQNLSRGGETGGAALPLDSRRTSAFYTELSPAATAGGREAPRRRSKYEIWEIGRYVRKYRYCPD